MAVSDFRVYDTTEGWVSMGDVAADKVTLPVPSADGTVVLNSPAANTFTIDTGGAERLRVRAGGNVSFSQSSVAPTTGTSANGITQRFDIANANGMIYSAAGYATTSTVTNAYGFYLSLSSVAPNGEHHAGSWMLFATNNCTSQNGSTINEVRSFSAADQTVADTAYGFWTNISPRSGKTRYGFYASGNAPNYFKGQVQVGPEGIVAIGDEDTGINFPAADTFFFETAGVERLRIDSTGDLLAATGYTPANPQSLATKVYADNIASGGFTLDKASATVLGGIKIGTGLEIDADGVASVDLEALGFETVTIPPGVDPALTAPLSTSAYLKVISSTAFTGRISLQIAGTTLNIPTQANGVHVQFRKQGDTNWTNGVVAYSDSSTQYPTFQDAKASGSPNWTAVWSFGGTVGETYETRWAFGSATGIGAWSTTIVPLVLAS